MPFPDQWRQIIAARIEEKLDYIEYQIKMITASISDEKPIIKPPLKNGKTADRDENRTKKTKLF